MKVGKAGKASPHAAYISRVGQYANRLERGEVLEAAEAGNMPAWAEHDPQQFWLAADANERTNGTTYREMEIALPRELTPAQRVDLGEICATQVGESSIRQRVVDPALDAPIFLIGVALFRDDLATVPLQCLTERSALGFGAIDVCAAIHFGLHASSPLLGLLLGVE